MCVTVSYERNICGYNISIVGGPADFSPPQVAKN
jgi:hypothetical protein